MKTFSITITAAILVGIFYSVSFIVYKSATSDTSNVNIIRTYIANETEHVDAHEPKDLFPFSCEELAVKNADLPLVDYMKAESIDSSFDSRLKLATEAGIQGYGGLRGQNDILKKYLIQKMTGQCEQSR